MKTVNFSGKPIRMGPFIPTAEQYKEELKPFTDAGWEVEFTSDCGPDTCQLRGRHQGLGRQFRIGLDVFELHHPEFMPDFLRRAWYDVQCDEARMWPFPKLRVYNPTGHCFEPADWTQFLTHIGLLGSAKFDQAEVLSTAFRRRHRIVLASPVRDELGRDVYELDWLLAVPDRRRQLMAYNEEQHVWRVLDTKQELEPSAACHATRWLNWYEQLPPVNYEASTFSPRPVDPLYGY